ncbi:MAG TPA: alpha-2-macroglobulin family protein, partial [Flavisolibacter sp.]
KELMVQPNAPRFVRQGDKMEFTAKIVNTSAKEVTGQAQLQLTDAATGQPVDGWFMNTFPNQYFTVAAGGSEVVKFPLQVPFEFSQALVWRVTARAGNISDAEENALPVLSNKVLVTETMVLPVRGATTKAFSFDKLLNAGKSSTLRHHGLTVEYTANPAWYVVKALPYLMEFPYECSEQIWNRYYANALAAHITSKMPRIRQVFEKWKAAGAGNETALLSNLEKNQELKSALLEETPWVLDAQNETQQRKNIALLFDMVRMSAELQANLEKLRSLQAPNGGFVWFKGGPDDRYITQYIVTGIGRLKKLGVNIEPLNPIVAAALKYSDGKLQQEYERLLKLKPDLNKMHVSAIAIQYLYMKSFFPEYKTDSKSSNAVAFYERQARTFWTRQSLQLQGMIALAMQRGNDVRTAMAIAASLKERSITSEELGTYWLDNRFGFSWYWNYAPVETQSLMVEAFREITKDAVMVDNMRTWLIKHKQTNNWRTTTATADACYAVLLPDDRDRNLLDSDPQVNITLGTVSLSGKELPSEAGSGYFRHAIPGAQVTPGMGKVQVTVSAPATSQPATTWGAVYWQYFEDMDKVTAAATPLSLSKKLFIERNTDRGPVLSPVNEGTVLRVGDKIRVRIELRSDRDMEYVHMKDMRASALEPVNVISGYRWQGGLGYYETTKDASTNFFFDRLRKGTYVFEYPLFVTHTGTFSNGITSIQC